MITTTSRPFAQYLLQQLVPVSGPDSYTAFLAQLGLRRVHVTLETHVVVGTYWAVKATGEDLPISVHLTQHEAINAVGELLFGVPNGGSLMIHRRNGLFREERTLNHPDPYPPRG